MIRGSITDQKEAHVATEHLLTLLRKYMRVHSSIEKSCLEGVTLRDCVLRCGEDEILNARGFQRSDSNVTANEPKSSHVQSEMRKHHASVVTETSTQCPCAICHYALNPKLHL